MASILKTDKIEGVTSSGTVAMPSGSVVQVVQREVANISFSTTNNATYTDVTNFYIDITPKFSDSIIIFEAEVIGNVNNSTTHADFRVVNSNNSDALIHTGVSTATFGYYNTMTTNYAEIPIRAVDANCGTTSTMRLQLQVALGNNSSGSHTFNIDWNSSYFKTITATEIKA